MSKKNTLIISILILIIIVLTGALILNNTNKSKTKQAINQEQKTITQEEILAEIEKERQKANEELKKIIAETDFDPYTASPEEVIEKINKMEEYFQEKR